MDSAVILVLVQRRGPDEAVGRATFELLAAAERLGTPVAVLCGEAADDVLDLLARYGAQRIIAVTPGASRTGFEVDALVETARRLDPIAILIAAGRPGEMTAARVAVRLESGIITDATDVYSGPDGLHVIQETIGGTYRVESAVGRGPAVITMHPGAIPASGTTDPAALPIVEHIRIDLPASAATARVLSRTAKRAAPPTPLDEADIVVAGGRGVGSAEGFGLLARIAAELGGRLGGTHTAEELGWCPAHARINLPGAQIRPRLYFAGGVSGSVRHRAAIRGAKTVVAIDRDPRAPIFRVADFGVVGDLKQVLPALLEEIRQRRNGTPAQDPPDSPPGSTIEPSDDNAEA